MKSTLQPVAPRIDDPIELLTACHEKVRRFARLTVRLRDHVAQHGVDAQARDAAAAVLRYFEVAAPLHHEDEEQDLFPALAALGDEGLRACMAGLAAEHEALAALWGAVRPWLQATAGGEAGAAPPQVDAFAARYCAHADREEAEVYPASSRLSPVHVKAISERMVARRTESPGA